MGADILFFAASNWLNEIGDFSFFADLIRIRNITVVIVGLGAQSDSEDYIPSLKQGTIDFLKEASKRSKTILVRGSYSKKICEYYGIYNVEVAGCPSVFYNTDKNLGFMLEEKYENYRREKYENYRREKYENYRREKYENYRREKIMYNIDLNREKYDKKKNYILQNEVDLMNRVKNGEIKNMKYFTRLKDWSDYLKEFDFAIGNRIHGTIFSLMNYIPAICYPIDIRVKELSETLKIPKSEEENFNGSSFEENRKYLAKKYIKLFEGMNIRISTKLLDFVH